VEEYLTGPGAPQVAGQQIAGLLEYAYRGTPWGAPVATNPAVVVISDGTSTAQGIYRGPIGAVPPGLRRPLDLAVEFIRTAGANGDNYLGTAVITGFHVDVAVTESAFVFLHREVVEYAEEGAALRGFRHELVSIAEAVALKVTHPEAEGVAVVVLEDAQMDPPVIAWEGIEMAVLEAAFMSPHDQAEGIAVAVLETWSAT
jgi:hypothetical protein